MNAQGVMGKPHSHHRESGSYLLTLAEMAIVIFLLVSVLGIFQQEVNSALAWIGKHYNYVLTGTNMLILFFLNLYLSVRLTYKGAV